MQNFGVFFFYNNTMWENLDSSEKSDKQKKKGGVAVRELMRAPLAIQWLRIFLPVQGTWVS